ncbi:hypothetical protein QRD43_07615 [Pelomonas sp. APW6]|uniref:Uncharacterized protein n=1 Tax=Roseateles subflavus TaxID=3053353 RepID=A0ABT7LG05_9BURK|nr:hypothetical protein [Pelomonas sp. APW6]MDL5031773.1 hypothetical protein [Pelomonas sp. APW6]
MSSENKRHSTYWGMQELSFDDTRYISGGDCEDGDEVTPCLPKVTINGSRTYQVEFSSNFLPLGYFFLTSGGGGGGSSSAGDGGVRDLPQPKKKEICDAVADETVAEVNRAKKDGRIPFVARGFIPSDEEIRKEAFRVCMKGLGG